MHKIRIISAGFLSLFFAGQLWAIDIDATKSQSDDRDYRLIELANRLQVLLISDPDAPKAAVSLDVNVGSAADPENRPGLAHFLEHMLFLGTEKYPESGEFQAFIARHGGASNAFTALDNTNYHFSIDHQHLKPALDRFSRFFIAPLFTESLVEREMQAVNSEFESKRTVDSMRIWSARRMLINPDHSRSQFNVGNLSTLAGDTIREELINFYRSHYSSNLMRLVVLGRETLPVLREWVEAYFTSIADRQIDNRQADIPVFLDDTLPRLLQVKTLKQLRMLQFTFPVPTTRPYTREKPVQYIGHLLGHEGEGSLLSLLKARGWVESLSAGREFDDRHSGVVTISMQLTESGLREIDEIAYLLFQAIDMLRRKGVQQWVFEELKTMAQLDYRFHEAATPFALVRALATRMQYESPGLLLPGPWLYERFDAGLIQRYLDTLRPENVLITVAGNHINGNKRSPWFESEYTDEPVGAAQLRYWQQPWQEKDLELPIKNPFLPGTVELLEIEKSLDIPYRLDSGPGHNFWFKADVDFKLPRAAYYFSIRSPLVQQSLQNVMALEMFQRLVNDQLNEFTYHASLAGLSWSLYRHMRGISVRIFGYNDKQQLLLDLILEALRNPVYSPARFAELKDSLLLRLRNRRQNPPYRQAIAGVYDLLAPQWWTDQARIQILENLSLKDVREFAEVFIRDIEVVSLAHGNVSAEKTEAMNTRLFDSIIASSKSIRVERQQARLLPAGRYLALGKSVGHDDSAFVLYFQGDSTDYSERARYLLLRQLMHNRFYQQLRTEQQQGYLVYVSYSPVLDTPGMSLVIQSPVSGPTALEVRVQEFLQRFADELSEYSPEDFAAQKNSIINDLVRDDERLKQRSNRYWSEIDDENRHFDSSQKLADAVADVSLSSLIQLSSELAQGDRSRLLVYSVGNKHRDEKKLDHDYVPIDATLGLQ